MKKNLLIAAISVICFLGMHSFTNAQTPQVNNSGFENWDNIGTNNVEPTQWNSFMTADATILTQFGKKKRVDRSTKIRPGTSGTYSAVIWSTNELGTIANGNLTCGKINMGSTTPTSQDNYNFTKTSDMNFAEALGGLPDSLIIWVYFKPASGNTTDSARVRAVIHDTYDYRDPSGSDANGPNHVVGNATKNFAKTNGLWTRKSVPFTYTGPASSPDYILISFTTNKTGGAGSAGDSLYVDDLVLFYNPALGTGTITPNTYYVSPTQTASISIPYTLTGTMNPGNVVTAELSDASGSFASPVLLGTLTSTTSGTISGTIPANTPTGSGYRIRVRSSSYPLTAADNGADVQIYLVSNSVAPASTQNIAENVAGSQITVTENPAGASREWKYSTASGGLYSSFTPAETGVNYTPLFATQGSYYVVCESQIGGIPVQSSEVRINVWSTVGIDNSPVHAAQIYMHGDNLMIDVVAEQFANPVLCIYDMTGRLIRKEAISGNSPNKIALEAPSGIFAYTINDNKKMISGKMFKK